MRLLVAFLAIGLFSASAFAENPKMKECAAEWQKMKADGKTEGKDYKTFSASCMKGEKEEVKTQQDKMKSCAKEWNDLKAANKTEGKTYKEFSSECLKK